MSAKNKEISDKVFKEGLEIFSKKMEENPEMGTIEHPSKEIYIVINQFKVRRGFFSTIRNDIQIVGYTEDYDKAKNTVKEMNAEKWKGRFFDNHAVLFTVLKLI
jgi:hypothetical protein